MHTGQFVIDLWKLSEKIGREVEFARQLVNDIETERMKLHDYLQGDGDRNEGGGRVESNPQGPNPPDLQQHHLSDVRYGVRSSAVPNRARMPAGLPYQCEAGIVRGGVEADQCPNRTVEGLRMCAEHLEEWD